MADNDDLTGFVPDPPPPDGDRRSKAIKAALRRFDEGHELPNSDGRTSPPTFPAAPNRVKFAVLASAALVVLVTVPLLMTQRFGPDVMLQRPQPAASERSVAIDLAQPPRAAEAPPPPAFEAAPDDAAAPPAQAQAMIAPLAGASPSESVADRDLPQVATAMPDRAPAAALPPAPARAPFRDESADGARALVVTGSRVSRPPVDQPARERRLAPTRRQIRAWQACTVADERRKARTCAAQNHAAPGAAEIARGLEYSFRGDDRGALKAFDAALAAAPGSATALLNRALVRQRLGYLDGAQTDFDRAVRSSPEDARIYYFRSLLLRKSSDNDRADEDLQKALDLAGEEARKR